MKKLMTLLLASALVFSSVPVYAQLNADCVAKQCAAKRHCDFKLICKYRQKSTNKAIAAEIGTAVAIGVISGTVTDVTLRIVNKFWPDWLSKKQ